MKAEGGWMAMKSFTAWVLAGTLMVLAVPMVAQAHEWGEPGYGYGWCHGEINHDRRDIRRDWLDVSQDRRELRQDLADGRWGAARAERADIYHDLTDIHRDQRDIYRDRYGMPRPNLGYEPMSYGTYPAGNYRPLPVANYTVPAPLMGQNYRGPNGIGGFLP
jgi:hypothetical protein